MLRLLLLASFSFLFLSSSTAALLGIGQLRIVLFLLIVLSLMLVAVLYVPRFARRPSALLLIVLAGLLWLACMDPTPDPIDYKLLLPILGLILAPNLKQALNGIDTAGMFWVLLAIYVGLTFSSFALDLQTVTVRGVDGFVRYDLTGSVVTHASLCLLALVMGVTLAFSGRGLTRILAFSTALMAGLMVLMTATRTSLFTLLLLALMALTAGPDRRAILRRSAFFVMLATTGFVFYSTFVSDAFLLRLMASEGVDYTSGRLHSVTHWIALALERPLFGHGIGFVRETLSDGRPFIDDGRLLEWPHNEFVRYFVEGGLLGLTLVAALVGHIVVTALRHAPALPPLERLLVLMIAADMVAQCLFQNYFNSVYQATLLLMLLGVLIARPANQRVSAELQQVAPGAPYARRL